MTYSLTVSDVCAALKCSRQSLYNWINAGTFPKPKMIGPRSPRWQQADLDAWLAERTA